jgi:hypothetical protein
MKRLLDYAKTLRSKNAGAFLLTIDVVMKSPEAFQEIVARNVLTPARIGALYGLSAESVAVIPYPAATAIKLTFPRHMPSGEIGDSDVYGAQQHVPIMMLEVDDASPIPS